MKKILVCLPAFNEAQNIGGVLDELILRRNFGDMDFDILVIDDGSADATRQIAKNRRIAVISHIFNQGYGAALKTAYIFATRRGYDYIIQMDADGQHDIANIDNILAIMLGADAPDIAIGSRFMRGSADFPIPIHKKMAIAAFRLIIHIAAKKRVTDPTSGLQGISRAAFTFYAKYDNFSLDYPDANMIIQMMLNDFEIAEFPAIMHRRNFGVSMHSGLLKPAAYLLKVSLNIAIICIREFSARRRRRLERKWAVLNEQTEN
ncbi:MAG: glycosyltransferase family 2 protein [Defluviitaleaceae bacterium]|nr:glycosyltransferase family 2 protein [Defluviitaleaceae bacterium]